MKRLLLSAFFIAACTVAFAQVKPVAKHKGGAAKSTAAPQSLKALQVSSERNSAPVVRPEVALPAQKNN